MHMVAVGVSFQHVTVAPPACAGSQGQMCECASALAFRRSAGCGTAARISWSVWICGLQRKPAAALSDDLSHLFYYEAPFICNQGQKP